VASGGWVRSGSSCFVTTQVSGFGVQGSGNPVVTFLQTLARLFHSYNATAVAAAALSDSTSARMGMLTARLRQGSGRPKPSRPASRPKAGGNAAARMSGPCARGRRSAGLPQAAERRALPQGQAQHGPAGCAQGLGVKGVSAGQEDRLSRPRPPPSGWPRPRFPILNDEYTASVGKPSLGATRDLRQADEQHGRGAGTSSSSKSLGSS
jgi:hypothetical protein